MKPAQLNRPVNLRVDDATRRKLDELAQRHGVKTSDIVRFAINAKIPSWERDGVHLSRTSA